MASLPDILAGAEDSSRMLVVLNGLRVIGELPLYVEVVQNYLTDH